MRHMWHWFPLLRLFKSILNQCIDGADAMNFSCWILQFTSRCLNAWMEKMNFHKKYDNIENTCVAVAILFSTNFLYSSRSFHHQKRIYNIYNASIEYYVTNCAHHINCNDKWQRQGTHRNFLFLDVNGSIPTFQCARVRLYFHGELTRSVDDEQENIWWFWLIFIAWKTRWHLPGVVTFDVGIRRGSFSLITILWLMPLKM